jgi:hypothetical protein
MYGEPMPGAEEQPDDNVIPFPKQLSLGLRRKILHDATHRLENE